MQVHPSNNLTGKGVRVISSLIEKDKDTGKSFLKIPVLDEDTIRKDVNDSESFHFIMLLFQKLRLMSLLHKSLAAESVSG